MSDSALGFLGRLRRIAASALGMVESRISLFATELEEDILQLGTGIILLMLAALFLAFGLFALLAFLTVLLWDNHRLLALGACTAIFFGASLWCAVRSARKLKSGKPFLGATRAEFEKDRDAFGRSES